MIIGIDIGGTKVSACVADTSGSVLAAAEHRAKQSGREFADLLPDAVELARRCVREAVDRGPHEKREILALGVVTPGIVTAEGIALAPNNPGISEADPSRVLSRALGTDRVSWANDVKAAALAEHAWGCLKGVHTGVFVNIGTGVSAGAVVNGEALSGEHGAALEIGSLLPRAGGPYRSVREGGAPLEDQVSGRALRDACSAAGHEELSASDLLVRAHAPDVDARDPLTVIGRDALTEVAQALVTVAIVLDPGVISLGGGVVTDEVFSVVRSHARTALDTSVPCPPRLEMTALGGSASLLGALLIAYRSWGGEVPEMLGCVGCGDL
nr:ROK family protein [Brachybacterium sp. ACRRE]